MAADREPINREAAGKTGGALQNGVQAAPESARQASSALPSAPARQAAPESARPTVGILYLCTGKYVVFWRDFYKTFAANFLPDCRKEWFVFTDAAAIAGEGEPGVHRIPQKAYDWPYSTLLRFEIFLTQEPALRRCDYLFFMNANLLCPQRVTAAEFLPRASRGETLLMVQQPGFYNRQPMFFTYERRRKSAAYIPYNCGRAYVSGGLNGGQTQAYLAMCRELARRTRADLDRGVVARWHDESQLNRYIAERPESTYRLLSPAYWYPEGWNLPFSPRITVRQKANWIDVGAVKGAQKRQNFVARKWDAFRENYLPRLWRWRDALLQKKLPSPPPGE
jgi:hypothetical protein